MKLIATLISTFSSLANAINTTQWTGYYNNSPVTDVTNLDIRCNVNGSTKSATATMAVVAGSKIKFESNIAITHIRVMKWYIMKVPAGRTAATWDGSGEVWFKIDEDHPTFGKTLGWPSLGTPSQSTTIPASLPAGDYLIRVEYIALHTAQVTGVEQFYISCGQLNVTSGGAGKSTPLVASPGAYSATDPGIKINVYYPMPASYNNPGPAVWKR